MPDEKEIIFDSPPSEPDDDFWLEQGRELAKGSMTALLDASKSLMTGLGVLKGIYLGILGFANFIPKNIPALFKFLFIIPLIFWLFALYKCLQVVMTREFRLHLNSPDNIKKTYEKIVKEKQSNLNWAFWSLAIGLVVAVMLLGFRLKI